MSDNQPELRPEPATQPGPTQPSSTQPGSAQLNSTQLGSAQPGSTQLGSAQLNSTQLGSAQPGSAQPGSAQLNSTQLGSAQPGSTQPGSAQLGSTQPGTTATGPSLSPSAQRGPARRRWARLRLPLILVAAAGLAAFGLWGRLPDPRAFVGVLTGADYWWVALAVVLQGTSLAAFAWQQRQLLGALGVRLRVRHAALVTMARTALSISLPAGGAVSAAYAVREYEREGTPREVGTASMIVSGLASIGGLTLLYVAGFAALVSTDPSLLAGPRPIVIAAVLAVLTVGAVLVSRRWMREPARGPAAGPERGIRGFVRRTLDSAREGWRAGAALRARDWIASLLFLAANWLTDLLCLAATCRAVGLPVGVTTLAGIYLGVQIVRQVPLTPGGVGVIDTALVAGLTAAGATAATAVAAVLVYRLISCWLLLPAGGVAVVLLRRRGAGPAVSRRRGARRAAAGSRPAAD